MYEKIVHKLVEYNEKMNNGREVSVVEYLKRIDQRSPFIQKYENQKHLRKAFFEEFKIHSFNYVLLLFESVIRMLYAVRKEDQQDPDEKEAEQPRRLRKCRKVADSR